MGNKAWNQSFTRGANYTSLSLLLCRYLAICHPLYSYTMSGLRRASKIITGLWFFAFVAAIPYAVHTKVHFIAHPYTNKVGK